mmetsp:Transcript_10899/g.26151  ORF Transcript_10899/g.26151 Transcript_10899/m.26151 type:complete len:285 (+) Transcript_10899:41-895(+)
MRALRGKWRAVALDLDGTTLNSSQRLTARTVDTIRKCDAAGVRVIIATGRPVMSLKAFVSEIGLPQPVPTVCFNGACATMLDPASDRQEALVSRGLSKATTESILRLCDDKAWCASYCQAHGTSVAPKSAHHEDRLQVFEALEGLPQERVKDLWALLKTENPLKVVTLAEDPPAQAAEARALLPPGAVHVVAAELHVEFLAADVSKGDTLRDLCQEHLGISMEDVIAFGDNFNDMEMLTLAGQGVAMQNAKDELKAVATRVSKWTNDEDGVARELEEMFSLSAE